MDVKLVVVGGRLAGKAVRVTGPKYFIGRAEDCQLRPNSDLVSRHHCALMVDDGLVTVRDFGSRNCTYVNGQRIRGEEELNDGDSLKIGPLEFQVRIAVEPTPPEKPAVESIPETPPKAVGAAPAKADDDELDIGGWLGQDSADAANETRTINEPSQQNTMAMSSDRTNVWKPPESTEPEPLKKEKREDKGAKKPSGKFHALGKPKAVDSQTAAEDVLRHFFNRR